MPKKKATKRRTDWTLMKSLSGEHTMHTLDKLCKMLKIIERGAGWKTRKEIAEEIGCSIKTVARYIEVMSIYFNIVEETGNGRGYRTKFARLCADGEVQSLWRDGGARSNAVRQEGPAAGSRGGEPKIKRV